jgi:uncharacterized membrane protein YeiH
MFAPSYTTIIEILGIMAFTVSGTLAAMEKKLDLFGILIIGFVTATGGGTIRDVLIGSTPVAWMRDMTTLLGYWVRASSPFFFGNHLVVYSVPCWFLMRWAWVCLP